MSKVAVADIIVPTIFERYVIERTAVLTVFAASGVIASDPDFDTRAGSGGNTINMPYFQDIAGARQIMSDAASLSVNKITTGQDIARIQNDANAWSVNVLASLLSGEDPMGAIGDLLGNYWARIDEAELIASLKGLTASTTTGTPSPPAGATLTGFATGNVLSIASETVAGQSAATRLNGSTFIDALVKLGDRSDRLTAIGMHSATEAALRKLDLIDFIPDSEGKSQIRTFQGRTVIVDDQLPSRAGTTDGTVYTSYLFGQGAFAKGSASLATPLEGGFGTEGVEYSRVSLASDSLLINRRRYILHPRGVKWTESSVAGNSPTDAELATASNWTIVYENKNVRCVAIVHNN